MDSIESTAAQFVQARLAGRSHSRLSRRCSSRSDDRLSLSRTSRSTRWPDRVAGWKVARIGPQWQAQYPEERLIGPVFARNVHVVAAGAEAVCPVFDGGFAAVEAEIGIHVRADAPADKTRLDGR